MSVKKLQKFSSGSVMWQSCNFPVAPQHDGTNDFETTLTICKNKQNNLFLVKELSLPHLKMNKKSTSDKFWQK